MSQALEIHDLAPESPLDSARFQELLAADSGPIAFRGDPSADPAAGTLGDSGIGVILANAGERGAGDLIGRLWRRFPRVAALLDDRLPSLGAVIFSPAARIAARGSKSEVDDPVGMGVARAISEGASVEAVVEIDAPDARAAIDPPVLVPGEASRRRGELLEIIAAMPAERLIPSARNSVDSRAVIAGLLLWHDDLHGSHSISQSAGAGRHRAGNYWHAIMHRREPDYGNAKYWFGQVGAHPIFPELAERAAGHLAGTELAGMIGGGHWDPGLFVDACQQVARKDNVAMDMALRCCQADEMLLLLEQTCRDAASRGI